MYDLIFPEKRIITVLTKKHTSIVFVQKLPFMKKVYSIYKWLMLLSSVPYDVQGDK